jgi:hypothetical protein
LSLFRLLNPQGIAGLAASVCLALLLLIQKGESRHWKKQSGQFEQLYTQAQAAFSRTVADYRSAVEQARREDAANAERVRGSQARINEETRNDFEKRLAMLRASAGKLRGNAPASADPRGRRTASMPGLPAAAGRFDEASGQDRLPAPLSGEDALIATEQAIQLDELIKWVRRQHAVAFDADPPEPRRP